MPAQAPSPVVLTSARRRQLTAVLLAALAALLVLAVIGNILERSEHTPLVRVGQPAPAFTLPANGAGEVSLLAQRGHPVLLAFVPSAQCAGCKAQLRLLESILPDLAAQQIAVLAISTDEPAVQQTISRSLKLTYPFLAEDVIIGRHPAGRAYGVYHRSGPQQGPVDANAVIAIDATGIVRAVDVRPAGQLTRAALLAFVQAALGPAGGAP
ncbi:MAG: peroxiredoxin family protein [Dehalococcoidia bacterium]